MDNKKNNTECFSCEEHNNNSRRISDLEKKFKMCESNTISISNLTGKITILIMIMSFSFTIVSGGAIYTFTGLNKFKDVYATNLIKNQSIMSEIKYNNTEKIQRSIYTLEQNVNNKIDKLNDKLINVERLMIRNEKNK